MTNNKFHFRYQYNTFSLFLQALTKNRPVTFSFPSFTNFSFCGIIEIIVTNQGQSRHKME